MALTIAITLATEAFWCHYRYHYLVMAPPCPERTQLGPHYKISICAGPFMKPSSWGPCKHIIGSKAALPGAELALELDSPDPG